jgi:hypothetical protein
MPLESNPVFYFYCQRNETTRQWQDTEQILRTIVWQLACLKPSADVPDHLQKEYRKTLIGGGKLALGDSAELITKLIGSYPSITLVIDALDDCNPDKVWTFLQELIKIVKISPCPVKILVSSLESNRYYQRMANHSDLKDSRFLDVRTDENSSEIETFVHSAVENSIRTESLCISKGSEDLKQQVIRALIDGAEGM